MAEGAGRSSGLPAATHRCGDAGPQHVAQSGGRGGRGSGGSGRGGRGRLRRGGAPRPPGQRVHERIARAREAAEGAALAVVHSQRAEERAEQGARHAGHDGRLCLRGPLEQGQRGQHEAQRSPPPAPGSSSSRLGAGGIGRRRGGDPCARRRQGEGEEGGVRERGGLPPEGLRGTHIPVQWLLLLLQGG